MFYRFRISIALAVLLSVVLAIPTFAGGWAVITLDALPTGVVAGEPFNIGFTVLQHGKTPMDGLDPTITATSTASPSGSSSRAWRTSTASRPTKCAPRAAR
jgi:hypothetical protein